MKSDADKAFLIWRQIFELESIDAKIHQVNSWSHSHQDRNWLETCREGQWITHEEMARRLGVTRAGYRKLEMNESTGKITLESLEHAAQAMECELVYCIRPKRKKWFSILLWEQVFPRAYQLYKQRTKSEIIKPLILGKIAGHLATSAKFRKEKGWARNEGVRSSTRI